MNSFKLQIQTPLKSVFNGEANSFSIKTDGGKIQVLSKHADLTSSVSFSPAVISYGDETDVIVIRNAVISFDNKSNTMTVLALFAEQEKHIDASSTENQLETIREMLNNPEKLNDYQLKYLENQKIGLEKQLRK